MKTTKEQLVARVAAHIPTGLTGDAAHVAAIEGYALVAGCMPSEADDTSAAWEIVEGAVRLMERPTVYTNGKPAENIPTEARETIAREIADGAAVGSVVVAGVTYSWD
jgi:hypothetical protein